MRPLGFQRRFVLGLVVTWLGLGAVGVSSGAAEGGRYFVEPVVEMRLKALPPGPLYWRVERFPTLVAAREAAGPASLAAEVAGRAWLFTLGAKGGVGGGDAVEIGPVPEIRAPEYLLRVNYAGGPPGAKTAVHTHPGSETFYVLTGRLVQRTAHGEMGVDAGGTMAGHAPGMAMEVSSGGREDLTALVMFVVDATRPFSSAAGFE